MCFIVPFKRRQTLFVENVTTWKNDLALNFEVLKANTAYAFWVVSFLWFLLDFCPVFSSEWHGWFLNNSQPLSQSQFLIILDQFLFIIFSFPHFLQILILVRKNACFLFLGKLRYLLIKLFISVTIGIFSLNRWQFVGCSFMRGYPPTNLHIKIHFFQKVILQSCRIQS